MVYKSVFCQQTTFTFVLLAPMGGLTFVVKGVTHVELNDAPSCHGTALG